MSPMQRRKEKGGPDVFRGSTGTCLLLSPASLLVTVSLTVVELPASTAQLGQVTVVLFQVLGADFLPVVVAARS